LNNLLGVVATESFFNCPVHDGGTYSGMEKVADFEQLKNMVLSGLNNRHVNDVLSFDGHEYEVSYEAASHSFIGVSIYIDGTKRCHTEDNGSGKLRWINT
jgi:hypothetical protein